MTPPTAEGGALRAQSLRRPSGEPVLLNGAVLRVDPATGDALPDNPRGSSTRPERAPHRRLRLPQPVPLHDPAAARTSSGSATSAGTTGRRSIASPRPTSSALNFGWPCYEGNRRSRATRAPGSISARRSTAPAPRRAPYFTYNHSANVVAGDNCPTGSSSITGLAFYTGASNYPSATTAASSSPTTPATASGSCLPGPNGLPDPTNVQPFDVRGRGTRRPRDRPERRPLLRRPGHRARSARSSTSAAGTTRRWRWRRRLRRWARRRLTGELRWIGFVGSGRRHALVLVGS